MHKRSGRAFAVIAMAGILTLATTAAGFPAKKVSATRWADSVCTAMGDWLGAIQQNSADVQQAAQEAQTSGDLTAITASFGSLFSNAGDATRDAAKAIKRAGYPNTPKGKQAQAALVKGFGKIAVAFDKLSTQAEDLRASGSQADVVAQMKSLQSDSQRRIGEFDKYFGKLDRLDPGHKLKRAFRRASACKALKS